MLRVELFANDVNIHRVIMDQVHIHIQAHQVMEAVWVQQVGPTLDIHIPMVQVECMVVAVMARVECMVVAAMVRVECMVVVVTVRVECMVVVVMVQVECTVPPIINITHMDKWDTIAMVIIGFQFFSCPSLNKRRDFIHLGSGSSGYNPYSNYGSGYNPGMSGGQYGSQYGGQYGSQYGGQSGMYGLGNEL